jgi:hypothetical protein
MRTQPIDGFEVPREDYERLLPTMPFAHIAQIAEKHGWPKNDGAHAALPNHAIIYEGKPGVMFLRSQGW